MDFEKIVMMFTMQEPFYGILLSSMERLPTNKISTIGVTRSGNVFRLLYNPDFIKPLSVDEVLTLLKHEVFHVAFNHFTIWGENADSAPNKIKELRNIAADLEINGYLDENSVHRMHGVLPKDAGWEKFLGSREYFGKLMQKAQQQQQQQQQQAQSPQMPCNGGQSGQPAPQQSGQQKQQSNNPQPGNVGGNNPSPQQQGQSNPQLQPSGTVEEDSIPDGFTDQFHGLDTHELWPKDMEEGELQNLQQVIDDMLDFAAAEVEKGRGTVPSELVGRIERIRKKPKPAADWKRYFRRYLGHEFSEFIRKSKKRESRRFPDAAGNRHRRKSHILVGIDTSGSVSMPEYKEFMGQIKTLSAVADFHVIECDAQIQYEYDYKGKPNEVLHGGGGTDFQPVVDVFNKNKRKYDALVYFTDGYCSVPNDTPKDTLWVISSKGTKDRKPFRKNGASVVLIPEKQN